MKFFRPTVFFILAAIAVITAYDFWAAFQSGDDTISAILLSVALKKPIVPFLFGVLMGHLFFPNAPVGQPAPGEGE